MKSLRLMVTLLFISMAGVFTACEKEGPIGPQGEQGVRGEKGDQGKKGDRGEKGDRGNTGPAGPRGATGPRGPRGATGPQGPPGAVNIMYSDWLDPNWNRSNTSSRKLHHFSVPELTSAFLDNGGVVLIYIRIAIVVNAPEVSLIPRQTVILNANVYSSVLPELKSVSIMVTKGDALTIPQALDKAEFKYVLIPGGVDISALAPAGINADDYLKAKQHLGR